MYWYSNYVPSKTTVDSALYVNSFFKSVSLFFGKKSLQHKGRRGGRCHEGHGRGALESPAPSQETLRPPGTRVRAAEHQQLWGGEPRAAHNGSRRRHQSHEAVWVYSGPGKSQTLMLLCSHAI